MYCGIRSSIPDKIIDSGSDEATNAEGTSARRSARRGADARAEVYTGRRKREFIGDGQRIQLVPNSLFKGFEDAEFG